MRPVSEVRAFVSIGAEDVPVERLLLVADEQWSPLWQAECVVPYTPERADLLDPQTTPRPRVQIALSRHWYGALRVSDLTGMFGGGTVAEVSALWAGLTAEDVTDTLRWPWERRDPWGDLTFWPPSQLRVDLVLRARQIDYRAGTMTIRAASDELLLQDTRAVVQRPAETFEERLLGLLHAAGLDPVYRSFHYAAVQVPAVTTTWTQTLWDEAEQTCRALGLRLFVDSTRTWRTAVVDPPYWLPIIEIDDALEAEDDSDLDGGSADAIVWHGRGITVAGVPLEETVTYPDPVPPGSRVQYVDRDYGRVASTLPMPDADELRRRLQLLRWSRRTQRIVRPIDPGWVVPAGAMVQLHVGGEFGPLSLPTRHEWRVPEDTLTLACSAAFDPEDEV